MNDILKKATAAHKPDSEQFAAALVLMQSEGTVSEKEVRLTELAKAAPDFEQSQFDDLFELLARELLDGR